MNKNRNYLKTLSLPIAILLILGGIIGLLATIGAQPVNASPQARRTTTTTTTTTKTTTTTTTTTSTTPTTTTTTTPPGPNGVWNIVSSPDVGSPRNYFYCVSGAATNDVWAVGTYGFLGTTDWQVIEHWNGSNWSVAASPSLTTPNELLAVAAITSNDVWAVGGYDSGGQSLIEHWNGTIWSVIPNPNPGTLNRFYGVAAISSSNVWAVGYYANGGLSQTLIEHWDGTTWSVIFSPNVANVYNQLNGISAVPGSPNELWAVGTAGTVTLVLHWNGTTWSIVSSPNAGTNPNLSSVAAISSGDVWAVGYTGGSGGNITFTMHWNGSTWSVVSSLNPSSTVNQLLGVTALATNNVLAVGNYMNTNTHTLQTLLLKWNGTSWLQVAGDNTGPTGLSFQLTAASTITSSDIWSVGYDGSTLAEHYNGTGWSIASTPNAGVGKNVINTVSGSSSTDVWEAGYYWAGAEQLTLIEHWNGVNWSIVPSANSGKVYNVLNGIVAISPTNAWAVGSADSGNSDQTTLILHWDGTSWSVISSPSPGTAGLNVLYGVTANSASDIWAAGSLQSNGSPEQTLIEHYNGSTWSVVSSPNVSGTNSGLFSVTGLGQNNVWAVGYSGSGWWTALVEHWNGSSWSIIPSPNRGSQYSDILYSVSGTGQAISGRQAKQRMVQIITGHWSNTGMGAVGVSSLPRMYTLAPIVTCDQLWQSHLVMPGQWGLTARIP